MFKTCSQSPFSDYPSFLGLVVKEDLFYPELIVGMVVVKTLRLLLSPYLMLG